MFPPNFFAKGGYSTLSRFFRRFRFELALLPRVGLIIPCAYALYRVPPLLPVRVDADVFWTRHSIPRQRNVSRVSGELYPVYLNSFWFFFFDYGLFPLPRVCVGAFRFLFRSHPQGGFLFHPKPMFIGL